MKPKSCPSCLTEIPPLEYYANHKKCAKCEEARLSKNEENFKKANPTYGQSWAENNREKTRAYYTRWRLNKKGELRMKQEFPPVVELRVLPKQKNPRIPKKELKVGVGSVYVPRKDHKREKFRAGIRELVRRWEEKNKEKMV